MAKCFYKELCKLSFKQNNAELKLKKNEGITLKTTGMRLDFTKVYLYI